MDMYFAIASGDGATDFAICYGKSEVRDFYLQEFEGGTGIEQRERADRIMEDFDNPDHWSGQEHPREFHVDLYCCNLTVYKVPASVFKKVFFASAEFMDHIVKG